MFKLVIGVVISSIKSRHLEFTMFEFLLTGGFSDGIYGDLLVPEKRGR